MPPKKIEESQSTESSDQLRTRSGLAFTGNKYIPKRRKPSAEDSTAQTSTTVAPNTNSTLTEAELDNSGTSTHPEQNPSSTPKYSWAELSADFESVSPNDSDPDSPDTVTEESVSDPFETTVIETNIMNAEEVKKLVADEVSKAVAAATSARQGELNTLQALVAAIEANTRAATSQRVATTQDIATALQGVRLSTVSATIKVPQWEPKRKSVASYLKELENYFNAMNYSQAEYMSHIGTVLPDEITVWYEHELPNLTT